jgi:asparagine synthase (glutamine-hydrolysing)
LRDWAEDLLDARRLDREGYLRALPIRKVWHSLLSGRSEWEYGGDLLWSVLMFEAWLDDQRRDTEPTLCDSQTPPARTPSPLSYAT